MVRPILHSSVRRKAVVKVTALITAALTAFGGLSGCATAQGAVPRGADATSNVVTAVAQDEQAFAIDLLQRLAGSSPNLVVSPSSIAGLLAMLELGAAGPTQAGIARALHSTGMPAADLASGFRSLNSMFSEQAAKVGVALEMASEAWLHAGFPLRASYVHELAAYFGAGVRKLAKSPESASRAVNNWVSSRTGGHIKDLVTPSEMRQLELLAVDAVYLDAHWATPFDPNATGPAPFHAPGGRAVTVEMMQTPGNFRAPALVMPSLDAVELNYVGDKLSALVLMPPEGQLGSFERRLSVGALAKIIRRLNYQGIDVELPRFSINTSLSAQLKSTLSAMGMSRAFGGGADFSNLSPQSPSVSFVVQDAQMKVAEKGTEAAAATAGGLPGVALPRPHISIVFNRPFLFLVRDNATGTVLFEAQVANPANHG